MQSPAVKLNIEILKLNFCFFADLELSDKKFLTDSDDDFELLWYIWNKRILNNSQHSYLHMAYIHLCIKTTKNDLYTF